MSKQTILELDINIDNLVKRAADVQKEMDELKAKTMVYKKAIKNTNASIAAESEELKNLVNQGKKNSKEYDERKQKIAELEKANDQNRQKLVLHNSELKNTQSEYRLAEKTVKVYNSSVNEQLGIITKTDGSINQISAALSKNKKVYSSLTKEQQNNEAIGGRLNKIISEQDAEYKKLHKSIGNNQVDVGNYKGQIGELIKKHTKFEGLLPLVNNGLKGIGVQIKGMTKAAIKFIATPLGAAIAIIATIGTGVKEWISFNLEIEKTNKLVRDLTQETGTVVDTIRIRAEVLKDNFGVELTESIEAAKSMVENLGISYDEAFDIIENGAVRGKLRNEDYLKSLKEYPVQFKNAGFSAKEFANIVETGIDLSIYQDKLPDAIKEFSLSVTEGTKPAKTAMQNAFGKEFTKNIFDNIKNGSITVKEALSKISSEAKKVGLNSQQAQQLTADLFKGAGEDSGGALKIFEAVNKALNEEQKPLSEIQKLKKEELEINKELQGVYKQIFASNSKGLGLIIQKGKLLATKTLLNILKRGVDLYNWFIEMNNTSGIFSAILTAIGKSATSVFQIIGIWIGAIIEGFESLGKVIKGVLTLDWDTFSEGIKKSINNVEDTIGKVKDKIVKDVTDVYDAFSGKNKKQQKISLETLVANDVTEETSDFKTKNKATSNDIITVKGKGKKKDRKEDSDPNKELDALIKKQEAELKLYITTNDLISASLKDRLKLYKKAYDDEKNILDNKLKAKQLTQEEYELALAEKSKEYAEKNAQAAIENANKELDLYEATTQSKLEKDKALTSDMINAEVERLQAINDKRNEILESQKNAGLISEQDYNLQKIQLENEFLEQKKIIQDEFKQQQKETEQLDYENELELKRLRGENEFALKLEELERQRLAEIAAAEKKGADINKINEKYKEKQKKIDKSVQEAQINSIAAGFSNVKQILGEQTAAGKAAAIAETTVNTYKAATAAYSAMAKIPVVGPAMGITAAATAIAAGLANVKKIAGINTKFQDGGLIKGKSHLRGGVPFKVSGESGFEAEGGEYIINKKSTAMFLPLLERINSQYKVGHPVSNIYQTGGIITTNTQSHNQPSIDYKVLAEHIGNSVAEANKTLPRPVVSVEDINLAQENHAEIVNGAEY